MKKATVLSTLVVLALGATASAAVRPAKQGRAHRSPVIRHVSDHDHGHQQPIPPVGHQGQDQGKLGRQGQDQGKSPVGRQSQDQSKTAPLPPDDHGHQH